MTLTIGTYFRSMSITAHKYMQAYAHKIGADFIDIDESQYSHCHYDKFRIYELLEQYDRIIYLDGDILITPESPNLFDIVPQDKFGALYEGKYATDEERQKHHQVILKASQEHEIQLPENYKFINAGIMIISKCHRELFAPPQKIVHMEYGDQPLMVLRIANSNTEIFDIGPDLNRMPYLDRLGKPRTESHIIHYAGLNNPHELMKRDIHHIENETGPKIIYVLNINNYMPKLCEITIPSIQAYADRIGARLHIITERQYPEWPIVYEKTQLWDLGKDNEWTIFIDADVIIGKDLPDLTEYMGLNEVGMHMSYDYDKHLPSDYLVNKDRRNIGIVGSFLVTHKTCHRIWEPFEETVHNIKRRLACNETKDHLIHEYKLSRNLARYGFKHRGITEISDDFLHLSATVEDNDTLGRAREFAERRC